MHRGFAFDAPREHNNNNLSRKPQPRRVMRRDSSDIAIIVRRARKAMHPFLLFKTKFFIVVGMFVMFLFMTTSNTAAPHDGLQIMWNGVGSGRRQHLRGGQRKPLILVHSDSQPFNEKSVATHATHLIIVAGHSVLISGDLENAARDDSVWYMYDYQRNRGLPQAIVSHIQAGIQIALHDENSLLVFSGGQTRPQTGPEAEGGSYFRVADALQLWDGRDVFSANEYYKNNDVNASSSLSSTAASLRKRFTEITRDVDRGAGNNNIQQLSPGHQPSTVRARTIAEEYATDSFENLLFSICRFREVTGSYPQQITLVSFSFKRQRFETLHAGALFWPLDHFHYIGIDPPSSTGFDLQLSSEGERTNSFLPFQSDPYGCHSEILLNKRKERNPFSRRAPYELSCPDMKDLLNWCGPEIISKEQVPWAEL